MKTAMQEMLEWLRKTFPMDLDSSLMIEQMIESLLEKEKEQIIDAYYGNIDGVFGYREEGEEYYNQTYNQKQIIIDIMKADENDGLYNQNK
jgi:hypothetical protein